MSLSKVVTVTGSEEGSIYFEEMSWLGSPGTYNTLPEPSNEVTMEEWFHYRDLYSPRYLEFRQPLIDGRYRNLQIEWFWDRGYGWYVDRQYTPQYIERNVFLRFGCLHKYVELSQRDCKERGIRHYGMCWHVYRCTECGRTYSEDSSD